jgi:hypothetical protein
MTPRYTGTVMLAEPRKSYLKRLDAAAWKLVRLSRREGNRTNYRMRVGDRLTFSIDGKIAGTPRAVNPTLLSPHTKREPIVKPRFPCPPFFVVRIGVGSR